MSRAWCATTHNGRLKYYMVLASPVALLSGDILDEHRDAFGNAIQSPATL